MSTKVAIICEDHTNDQFILEPVVNAALKAAGAKNGRAQCVTSPRLTGFSTLLTNMCQMIQRYHKTVSLIVIAFDLDGEDGQEGRPDKMAKVRNVLETCDNNSGVVLLACTMEAEVFALWGSRSGLGTSWTAVRAEAHPKERFFDGQLGQADALRVDGGRTRLITQSLRTGWTSLKTGCPELAQLESDIRTLLA